MQKSSKLIPFTLAGTALIGGLGVSFLISSPVEANMKFARDTGLSCASCHSTPSNPTKQALTNVGVRFKTCIYNPNPGTIDCSVQAVSDARNFSTAPTPQVYGQSPPAPSYPPPGVYQPPQPGYPTTGQQPGYTGYPPQGAPIPPAPPKKSNGVRDFLLGLLGAPATTAQTPSAPGYPPTTNYPPPQVYTPPTTGYNPGHRWVIVERLGNGRVFDSSWTKRPGSNSYDAIFMDSLNGTQSSDIVHFQGFQNGQINFRRQGTGTVYSGRLTADGKMVLGGTTNKSPANLTWTGTVFDR